MSYRGLVTDIINTQNRATGMAHAAALPCNPRDRRALSPDRFARRDAHIDYVQALAADLRTALATLDAATEADTADGSHDEDVRSAGRALLAAIGEEA